MKAHEKRDTDVRQKSVNILRDVLLTRIVSHGRPGDVHSVQSNNR